MNDKNLPEAGYFSLQFSPACFLGQGSYPVTVFSLDTGVILLSHVPQTYTEA